jgi:MFS superfamily sulfate permease-like transporter
MDIAGARMLRNLHAELTRRGIAFRIVEARARVRDMLRVEGVEESVGRIDHRTSLADAIEDFQKQTET